VLHRVFIDDSSDGTQSKYTIAAGLIGTHKTWNDFERRWKKVLQEHPPIDWFHSKEWRSLTEQFAQFRDDDKWPKPRGSEAATAKREKLKQVIEDSPLVAVGVGVLIPDFKLVRGADPRAAEFFRPDPYEGALQSIIYECAKAVQLVDSRHCVSYVSDNSNKSPTYSAIYSDFKKKNPEIASMMRNLVHLDDEKSPGLQAADLVAHVTNQVFKQEAAIPAQGTLLRESLPELQPVFYKIATWNKWWMCHVLKDLTGVDIFDKLGLDRRTYKSDEELDNEKKSGQSGIQIIR
jgi:hypothetical protein